MPKHEQFEELIALAAIGQVSAEEHRAVVEHLRSCGLCRRANEDFSFILEQVPLPEPSTSDRTLLELQEVSYRDRFIQRASSEGIRFTPEAVGRKMSRAVSPWFLSWPLYAMGAATGVAAMILATGIGFPHSWFRTRPSASARYEKPFVPPQRNSDPSDQDREQLHHEKLQAENRAEILKRRLERAQLDNQEAVSQSAQWKDEVRTLESRLQSDREELDKAKTRLDVLTNDKAQAELGLVAQQYRIKELQEQLEEQKAAAERERQLTAAARDVRELMGARNLHIIDVADLDGQGRSKKSFGRVFYTEGRSLIFYAFDLSQKGSASKVSFQAWGQNQQMSDVKSLGVFHIDDQIQRRWVLRVDNPELLKSVESVFVTVEPSPGRDQPSGHKLLYAYLGTQANHP